MFRLTNDWSYDERKNFNNSRSALAAYPTGGLMEHPIHYQSTIQSVWDGKERQAGDDQT
jgi:hypothetical protein